MTSALRQPIVFTDLDGTLLDAVRYSFAPARPALALLREKGIPLVLCSSKTRAEIEHYRQMLDNRHPFIIENGGGLFIPHDYFPPEVLAGAPLPLERAGSYLLIRLGAPYRELRAALARLRAEGFPVKGFGDMTAAEVAALTGLSLEEAAMAKEREFDEPFVAEGPSGSVDEGGLRRAIEAKGLSLTKGAFFHLTGATDKGKAVSMLTALYARRFGPLATVALGDDANDLPMLKAVEWPVIVRKPGGSYDPRLSLPGVLRAEGIGPEGWNRAVLRIVSEMGS